MNDYTVELTNGIEILVSGTNEAEALQNAQSEGKKINQQVIGNVQLLDCSIPS